MMAVTMPGVAIDSQNDESNGAEKSNFSDSVGADLDRARQPATSPTSPLEGEVGAAQQRREGGAQRDTIPRSTPLPGPPP